MATSPQKRCPQTPSTSDRSPVEMSTPFPQHAVGGLNSRLVEAFTTVSVASPKSSGPESCLEGYTRSVLWVCLGIMQVASEVGATGARGGRTPGNGERPMQARCSSPGPEQVQDKDRWSKGVSGMDGSEQGKQGRSRARPKSRSPRPQHPRTTSTT